MLIIILYHWLRHAKKPILNHDASWTSWLGRDENKWSFFCGGLIKPATSDTLPWCPPPDNLWLRAGKDSLWQRSGSEDKLTIPSWNTTVGACMERGVILQMRMALLTNTKKSHRINGQPWRSQNCLCTCLFWVVRRPINYFHSIAGSWIQGVDVKYQMKQNIDYKFFLAPESSSQEERMTTHTIHLTNA